MISAKKENICLARWLIEAGADPAKVDTKGNTAMDYAMLSGNEQLIAVLETATADAAA
jgi:ankyrin repeat protein